MRVFFWMVLILLLASLVNWVRRGVAEGVPIPQTLPLLTGLRPGPYDLAAAIMLMIAIWGIRRCRNDS